MRDLAGHDRSPSAFLVYLHLWTQSARPGKAVRLSHSEIAEAIGISKSAVQNAIRLLLRRRLLRSYKESATAVPEYYVLTPWRK